MRLIKEIIKLLRDPKTFATLFLGPILITFLIGGVYKIDYMNYIPIVVLDEDNTQMSRMLVEQFDTNERFYVSEYATDYDEFKDTINNKDASMGIYIPKDFTKDVKEMKSCTVPVFFDGSNITIANTALASASEILATLNAGVDIKVLEGKNIDPTTSLNLAKFYNMESRLLYDPKMTYKGYIMPGIILVFVQQLFLSAYVPKLIDDRENILKKGFVYSAFSALAFAICSYVLREFFDISMIGSIFVASIYAFIFVLSLIGIALMIAIVFRDSLKASQFTMLLSMPTFLLAGYAWPIEQMPSALTSLVKVMWPLIYAMPFIRDILIKGTSIYLFKNQIISLIVFGAVWFVIAYMLFKKVFMKGKSYAK